MPKKGENIYKRKDGRWEGRYIRNRTKEKKIVYGYVYGKKYAEVKEKLIVMKAKQLTTRSDFCRYNGNYNEWVNKWLMDTVRRKVKSSTYSNYVRLTQRHIIPELGNYKLSDLQDDDIQQFVYALSDAGLASGSVRLIVSIVQQSFKEAVKKGNLKKNPCDFIELPKLVNRPVHALSKKEQKEIEQVALEEQSCSPVILSLYSGMRIGEISGLRWADIDFERNLIRVNRTVVRILDESNGERKTTVVETAPKSAQSSRLIPLAENLKSYLLEKKSKTSGLSVIECRNGLAEPRVISYRFKQVIRQTSVSTINFHVLRHTFATRSLEQGVDIASLSAILGHQSTKLTLDTYTDSLIEQRVAAIALVDKLLKQ